LGRRTRTDLRRHRRDNEEGAELLEFSIVIVLLIMLVYGIASLGLILAAKATLTQAAEDGARTGIVSQSLLGGEADALNHASGDLEWMGSGTPSAISCAANPCQAPCGPTDLSITCTATEAACPSSSATTCLTIGVSYPYQNHPLIPTLLFTGLTPNTVNTSATLQWTPSLP
jgi:Flp pilus assembly protein TadG